MIELDEIKNRLKREYDLQGNTCRVSSSSKTLMEKLTDKMNADPERVAQIEEEIGQGEEFRIYFADKDSLKDFMALHDEDVDKFYRILRKEELFLNTCLRAFGFGNVIISLDPNTLLASFEESDEDEDDEYK